MTYASFGYKYYFASAGNAVSVNIPLHFTQIIYDTWAFKIIYWIKTPYNLFCENHNKNVIVLQCLTVHRVHLHTLIIVLSTAGTGEGQDRKHWR